MGLAPTYTNAEPTRTDVDALTTPTVIEFGTAWCGFCRAARPLIAAAFESHPDVNHLMIEDGSGRRLGRSFKVKLWPTLVFLREGKEIARLVRPTDAKAIEEALNQLSEAT